MGLDVVELAMDLEDRFGIAITDEEAVFLLDTPRRIVWLIAEKLAGRNPPVPDFGKLASQILEALRSMPDYKTRWFWSGQIEKLVPIENRQANWKAVSDVLGLALPPIEETGPWRGKIPESCSTLPKTAFWVFSNYPDRVPLLRGASVSEPSPMMSMTIDQIWEGVRESICESLGVEREKVTLDTSMEVDLGIG